jgi:hypothetical protein
VGLDGLTAPSRAGFCFFDAKLTARASRLATMTGFLGAFAPNLKSPCVENAAHEQLGLAMLLVDPSQRPADSLIAESRHALTQHPAPVIAIADDGAVVFANTAFAVPRCLGSGVSS